MPKISQHITPNIVSFVDNKLAIVARFEGLPFESIDDNYLYSNFINLKNILNSIGKLGEEVAIWTTVKRRKIVFDREFGFNTSFSKQFAEKYIRRLQEKDYFENVFYLTVIMKYEDLKDGIRAISEIQSMIENGLKSYDPYILTAYQNQHGVIFSEVFEFFGDLVNGFKERIPLTHQDAYQTIGSSVLHFGEQVSEIRNNQGKQKFVALFDLADFGLSKTKVLTPILTLPCEFVFTQSFVFVNSFEMQKNINKKLNNLVSSGDQAYEQQAELEEGIGGLQSGKVLFGDYSAVLAVFGDTAKQADANASIAFTTFLNCGAYRFVRAKMSAQASWFSQVPNAHLRPRKFPKTTENLACTFGMHNYSHGKKRGNPWIEPATGDSPSVMPLETISKTIYDFHFCSTNEKEDNAGERVAGHTLILGATGTGKTTLQTAILTFAERFNPFIFALDLDRGMEIWIRALGGDYFAIEAGEPTGLNPFQLPDTPENREFLYSLVAVCGQDNNGQITAEEEKQIKFAVDTVMDMDFETRRFSMLLQSIRADKSNPNCLRVRLEKWCYASNGRYAWCLDNETNKFDPETFFRVGFEVKDILKDKSENYPPTAPILAVLFRMKDIMLDRVALVPDNKGLLATIVEEFWYASQYESTQDFILKALKTGRKLGEFMILVSQSPEDAIKTPIFSAIVQQTPTKILLPNPAATWESYSQIGLTRKEYDELMSKSLECREFLIKKSKQSSFAKLNLSGFSDEIVVLSGNSSTVAQMHEIMGEVGDNPDDWLPLLQQKVRDGKKKA